MEGIRKIMVLALEVRNCRQTVHQGISLAKLLEAQLFILHVEHNPFGAEGWNLPLLSLDEDYVDLVKEAKSELDRILSAEKADGLPVREIIVRGEPEKMVRGAVEREGIDLLIAPAHEESRLEHFLFGRINESILRNMPCSVLFVKENPSS
ncbi:MAG TPA: universal stress protein [Candidatus Deferrimicrobiaceae bacterium]